MRSIHYLRGVTRSNAALFGLGLLIAFCLVAAFELISGEWQIGDLADAFLLVAAAVLGVALVALLLRGRGQSRRR